MDKDLEFAVTHKMKMIYSDVPSEKYSQNVLEDGNINASILCILSKIDTTGPFLGYKKTEEFQYISKILNYVGINLDNVKVTALHKIKELKKIDKNLKNYYEVLLFQILNENIKHVLIIGYETAKLILTEYLLENKKKLEDINNLLETLLINQNIKNVYNLYGKKVIILPSKNKIQKFTKEQKEELIEVIKKMKEE